MALYGDLETIHEESPGIWALIPEAELAANPDLASIVETHKQVQASLDRATGFEPYAILPANHGVIGDLKALNTPQVHLRQGGDPRMIFGEARGMFSGYGEFPLNFVSYGMARGMALKRGYRVMVGPGGQRGFSSFVDQGDLWGKYMETLTSSGINSPQDALLNIYALASAFHATRHAYYFHSMDGDVRPKSAVEELHQIEEELRAHNSLLNILNGDGAVVYDIGAIQLSINDANFRNIFRGILKNTKINNPLVIQYLEFALGVKILNKFREKEYSAEDGDTTVLQRNIRFAVNSMRAIGVPDEVFVSEAVLTGSQKIYQ